MTLTEFDAAMAAAQADGWTFCKTGKPDAGVRVDVMHVLNRSYDTDGEIDDDGQWHCSNGFLLPNMMFTFSPTHWRAKQVS